MAKFEKIAMIGCGSMGGGMALLFAEVGVHVSLSDPSEQAMDAVIEKAEKSGYNGEVKKYNDYSSLCKSLSKPRLLVFSLPHGGVGDEVLQGLMPHLERDDIILDCGNEHFANTERRQHKVKDTGIRYIGCGVSGGYQAARAGPSMCPGGDRSALNEVLPLLEKVAAKDKNEKPCVGIVGKGGSGHYVKMVHNGIEHGMMSAICEAWGVMRKMGMGYEEIGDVLKEWNSSGELKGTFLISIGADLSHKRVPDSSRPNEKSSSKGEHHPLVISEVLDKVVQDITGEEGTGIWSNTEAIELHVPAFTLNIAHAFRLASAFRGDREKASKVLNGGFPPSSIDVQDKASYIEALRKATYAACLASFIQGFNIIARADQQHDWNIDYSQVWQIWRAGCIIQADYISDEILAPILKSNPTSDDLNLNFSPRVAQDIKNCFPALRRVVAKSVETDQVTPAISATLEYFKVASGTDLPTSFYEAELDYFGSHMFDKKGDRDANVKKPMEGKHHFEWKPATSQKEVYGKNYKV
ncbi:decarboxylating 6-phosphogluconate dehydrogenase [Parastagonospora nodorum]|nr:decarboxylating 6-phosphogluconate dehydrogenase [Parastagonospora nodorum]KAH4200100.1 decarboxylating 6-phosphogluconate dehydrogenase [Parastagonospora nodorum]KAH4235181.1 decarboxylating 6-phosphogluconate dehydrogenase [Parastagonospora nodorum]KAH4249778.1 decarboxylating 6-phosphogluconate dehydrogenase [Parastagonospora nodorum]KAH5162015.1 decarboxylating 6-phosphogluconate dehydrogenase [Parastagonospora nodorum]